MASPLPHRCHSCSQPALASIIAAPFFKSLTELHSITYADLRGLLRSPVSTSLAPLHLPIPLPLGARCFGDQEYWLSQVVLAVSSGTAAFLFVIHSFVLLFLSFVQYSWVIWGVQITAIITLHSWQCSFIYLQTNSVSFKVTMKRIINKFKTALKMKCRLIFTL